MKFSINSNIFLTLTRYVPFTGQQVPRLAFPWLPWCCALLLVMPLATASAGKNGHLVAGTITLAEKKAGNIYLQLTTREEFAQSGKPRFAQVLPVTPAALSTGVVPFLFTAVPGGHYALQAFQDANNNGTFDFTLFFPAEPWGNYRPARPRFRGPQFEELAFDVQQDMETIEIILQ